MPASTTITTTTITNQKAAGEQDPLLPSTAADCVPESTKKFTNGDTADHDIDDLSPWTDVQDTVRLGIPIFLAMASWVGMKLTDSALLGHVSAQALAAASLSDLWTMCTAVLIQGRVLSVLTGAAIGAGNPALAGIYLQVSLVVLACLGIVVMACWCLTGWLWKHVFVLFDKNDGSDNNNNNNVVADMAGYYATVLSLSIPAQIVFGQVSQFFSSQRIMHPEVTASAVALLLNLILGLWLVLGIPRSLAFGVGGDGDGDGDGGFGFTACPIVTTSVVYMQALLLVGVYCGILGYHKPCWPTTNNGDGVFLPFFHWPEITRPRIQTFGRLYFPAALGMASDFWRVAVVGTAAARLGDTEVAVFNTSYRLMWVVLIAISSLASAAGIKVTLRLGRNQGLLAKQAGMVGLAMSASVLMILGVVVYLNLDLLGRIFTNDAKFLQLLRDAGLPFTVTLVLMNFAVALERLPYAMGRTQEVFWYGLVASWGFQVPAVYVLTIFWRDDLTGLYTGMAIGYGVLVFLYGWIVWISDWDYYAKLAMERSEMPAALSNPNVLPNEIKETKE